MPTRRFSISLTRGSRFTLHCNTAPFLGPQSNRELGTSSPSHPAFRLSLCPLFPDQSNPLLGDQVPSACTRARLSHNWPAQGKRWKPWDRQGDIPCLWIISTRISITMMVPVRPIPALEREKGKKKKIIAGGTIPQSQSAQLPHSSAAWSILVRCGTAAMRQPWPNADPWEVRAQQAAPELPAPDQACSSLHYHQWGSGGGLSFPMCVLLSQLPTTSSCKDPAAGVTKKKRPIFIIIIIIIIIPTAVPHWWPTGSYLQCTMIGPVSGMLRCARFTWSRKLRTPPGSLGTPWSGQLKYW